jgi:hypothetical protein
MPDEESQSGAARQREAFCRLCVKRQADKANIISVSSKELMRKQMSD